jgi:hypothetical protein
MNRDYQQNFPRFAKYLWRPTCAMLGLVLTCNPSIAQETDNPQLSAWYQVEVVIFTQQGYAGNEQPPKEYSLDFPENTLELFDTDYIGNNYPIIDYDDPNTQRAIPLAQVEDPALTFATAAFGTESIETANSEPFITPLFVSAVASDGGDEEAPETPEPEEIYIPEYEKPFIKLDKEFRDLNDSARALSRRAKYNVVFHEAWRFAADENASDPWVIIKAGKQYQDRYEIEGSLRFYKSRFLHFQSDLWLSNFADDSDSATLVELPAFPSIPEQSLSDGQESLEVLIDEKDLENFFIGSPTTPANEINTQIEEPLSRLQPTSYPLSTLWTFDQSKRLEEQQSYYMDHPKMGILVIIKPHEVEITNPLEEKAETVLETASINSSDSGLDSD